jgi:hypothetical protein
MFNRPFEVGKKEPEKISAPTNAAKPDGPDPEAAGHPAVGAHVPPGASAEQAAPLMAHWVQDGGGTAGTGAETHIATDSQDAAASGGPFSAAPLMAHWAQDGGTTGVGAGHGAPTGTHDAVGGGGPWASGPPPGADDAGQSAWAAGGRDFGSGLARQAGAAQAGVAGSHAAVGHATAALRAVAANGGAAATGAKAGAASAEEPSTGEREDEETQGEPETEEQKQEQEEVAHEAGQEQEPQAPAATGTSAESAAMQHDSERSEAGGEGEAAEYVATEEGEKDESKGQEAPAPVQAEAPGQDDSALGGKAASEEAEADGATQGDSEPEQKDAAGVDTAGADATGVDAVGAEAAAGEAEVSRGAAEGGDTESGGATGGGTVDAGAESEAAAGAGAGAESTDSAAGGTDRTVADGVSEDAAERAPHAVTGAEKGAASVVHEMQGSFGEDFSGVGLSPNLSPADANGAKAVALDEHVAYDPAQVDPSTGEGKKIIGHELAHIVQKRHGTSHPDSADAYVEFGPSPPVPTEGPDHRERLEREADDAGNRAARGERAKVASGAKTPVYQFWGWDDLKKTASVAWNKVKDKAGSVAGTVKDTASGAWNSVKDTAGGAWSQVKQGAGGLWNKVKQGASGAWNSTKGVAAKGRDLAKQGWGKVQQGAEWFTNQPALNVASWTLSPIFPMGPVLNLGAHLIAGKPGKFLDQFQTVLDIVGVVDPTGIADGANALIHLARGNYAEAALSAISIIPYIGDVVGKGGKVVKRLMPFLKKAPGFLKKGWNLAKPFLKKGVDLVAPLVKKGISKVAPWVKKGWEGLKGFGRSIGKGWDNLKDGIKKAPNFFRDKARVLRDGLARGADWATKKWLQIKDGIKKAPSLIKEKWNSLKGLPGKLYDKWRGWRYSIPSKLKGLWDGHAPSWLKKGIDLVKGAPGKLKGLWDRHAPSWLKKGINTVRGAFDRVKKGVKDWAADKWQRYAPKWLQRGAKKASEKWDAFKGRARRIYNKIVNPYPHTKKPGAFTTKPTHPPPSPQRIAGQTKAKTAMSKSHTDPDGVWDQKVLNDPNHKQLKDSLDEFAAGDKGKSVKDLDLSKKGGEQLHEELLDKGFKHKREPLTKDVDGQREFVLSRPGQDGKMTTSDPTDPNIVSQDIYTHADGGMVRVKPEGDPSSPFRPQPHSSKSVLHDPNKGTDLSNEAFKVTNNGEPVPKSAFGPTGMKPKGDVGTAGEYKGYSDEIMDAGHADLAP